MKFLITWNIPEDKWIPVLKTFCSMSPAERADVGEGVELVGRYHDVVARTGVAIFEAKDVRAVQRYALRWNPHMQLTISPVLEDEEAASVYGTIAT
jgi:hypothetical protein